MSKLRVNPLSVAYHLIRRDVHNLEYDPAVQLRVNIVMARFWFLNFFAVLIVDVLVNPFWQKVSILYLALVSIYANMVGHYSGIPASYAAMKASEIQQAQQQPPTHQDIMNELTSQISTDILPRILQDASTTDFEQKTYPAAPSAVTELDSYA